MKVFPGNNYTNTLPITKPKPKYKPSNVVPWSGQTQRPLGYNPNNYRLKNEKNKKKRSWGNAFKSALRKLNPLKARKVLPVNKNKNKNKNNKNNNESNSSRSISSISSLDSRSPSELLRNNSIIGSLSQNSSITQNVHNHNNNSKSLIPESIQIILQDILRLKNKLNNPTITHNEELRIIEQIKDLINTPEFKDFITSLKERRAILNQELQILENSSTIPQNNQVIQSTEGFIGLLNNLNTKLKNNSINESKKTKIREDLKVLSTIHGELQTILYNSLNNPPMPSTPPPPLPPQSGGYKKQKLLKKKSVKKSKKSRSKK